MDNQIMDLNEVVVFVKVVRNGSFVSAARMLEMPKSTVSAKITALEKRLGITLIKRTTRKLSVTAAGQAYFERCLSALDAIQAAESELITSQSEPQGKVRLTAPLELGGILLPAVIQKFQKLYPKVQLEIDLNDRKVDLIGEGFDLAVRAGALSDSSLMAKKLGTVYFAPFASQRYLETSGVPKEPTDLRKHSCLQFRPFADDPWKFSGPRGTQKVAVPFTLTANDLNLLKALAVAGLGIALLPTFLCYQEVQSNKLARVLPSWRANTAPVHFVHPAQKFVPPPLRAFMDVSAELIHERLGEFEI